MANNAKNYLLLWSFMILLYSGFTSSQEKKCSEVKCPPMSTINCPPDSNGHEYEESTELTINSNGITPLIEDDIFNECCITKKCTCKEVCDVPACFNSSLVPIEIVPGSNIPGKCCPKYECRIEPNCNELFNTSGYWLIDCQRCECVAGQKLCHRSCDEIRLRPANCLSLNFTVFSNGDNWKEDECTHCECHNGEKKCQTSFCRAQNCAHKIKISGECCPICVSKIDEIEKLSIPFESTTITPESLEPCTSTELHTEIVEVIIPNRQNCILYGVIVALTIVLIIFIGLYLHEKSKQRSYRPVSALDDNFNKITGKIKSKEYTFA